MGYSTKLKVPERGQSSRCNSSCGNILESHSDWQQSSQEEYRSASTHALSLQLRGVEESKGGFYVQRQNFMHWWQLWLIAITPGCLEFLCGKTIAHQDGCSSGKAKAIQISTDRIFLTLGQNRFVYGTNEGLTALAWLIQRATMQLVRLSMKKCRRNMKRTKTMAKTRGKIRQWVAWKDLNASLGSPTRNAVYETECVQVSENDRDGAPWSMPWVLAINAVTRCSFLLWGAWRRVNDKLSKIEGYYEALQGDAEEVQARVEAMETRQEKTSVFAAELTLSLLSTTHLLCGDLKAYLQRREKNYLPRKTNTSLTLKLEGLLRGGR